MLCSESGFACTRWPALAMMALRWPKLVNGLRRRGRHVVFVRHVRHEQQALWGGPGSDWPATAAARLSAGDAVDRRQAERLRRAAGLFGCGFSSRDTI